MKDILIKAEGIYKSYIENDGKLEILKGASLEISRGQTVSITGQSGCGKSTLLHILGMLDKPDQGRIVFNGKEISTDDKKLHKFRNNNLGFVFQFHYLLEDFTAIENVAMPMLVSGKSHKVSLKQAEELLKLLDMKDRKDHYPNQLSGGEQQRIAIARALINRPDLLLADEPTGNLDPTHSTEVIDLLLKLNKEIDQTVLLVTHNPIIADQTERKLELVEGILIEK